MQYVFISGWPRGEGKGGISQYSFNPEDGSMQLLSETDTDIAFGTVFVNEEKRVLYAVNEIRDPKGGNIYSYRIKENGEGLEFINKVSTQAPNPSYMGIDKTGKYAFCSNHSMDGFDAPVLLYSVNEDGSIGEVLDRVDLTGSSVGPKQNMPHPHCTVLSPDGRFVAVCDKGTDDVRIFRLNPETEKLEVRTQWKAEPGFMPRYCAFHPTRPFFYHNNESNAVVNVYAYDSKGRFAALEQKQALPEPTAEQVNQQGICIHPTGKYLYTAIKGVENIAVFAINQTSGLIELIQNVEEYYDWIRDIRVTPDGRYLIATFLESGKVVVYSVGEDGMLTETGNVYDCSRAAGIAITEI